MISISCKRGSSPSRSTEATSRRRPPHRRPSVFPVLSVKRAPSAWAMPAPPSTVALSPRPTTRRSASASNAREIKWPVP